MFKAVEQRARIAGVQAADEVSGKVLCHAAEQRATLVHGKLLEHLERTLGDIVSSVSTASGWGRSVSNSAAWRWGRASTSRAISPAGSRVITLPAIANRD